MPCPAKLRWIVALLGVLLTSLAVWGDPATWSPEQDASVVQVHRRTGDSDLVRRLVLQTLRVLPPSLKGELFGRGVHIVVAPTVTEFHPEFKGRVPRGYRPDQSYDHVKAQYRSAAREVLVAESALRGKGTQLQINREVSDATLHELGHAFDHTRGILSARDPFRTAYEADQQKLSAQQRGKYRYFLQTGKAGPLELFAEMFQVYHHRRARVVPRNANLIWDFPTCYAIMESTMAPYPVRGRHTSGPLEEAAGGGGVSPNS